jgi:hypothetical protein
MLHQPPTMAPMAPQSTHTVMNTMVPTMFRAATGVMVMLTSTPEGKAPGSLRVTEHGLQLTGEEGIPSQLSILSLQQLLLSQKPSLELAILMMISPPKQAIQLILSHHKQAIQLILSKQATLQYSCAQTCSSDIPQPPATVQ